MTGGNLMAIFTNQATLTYNGNTTNSNIAVGEILEVLVATKTAVDETYTPGELVTYVVTLRNTGTAPLTGLTITDDLGGYLVGGNLVYPLTYEAGTATLFVNGVPQADPAVTAGPPLTITGLTVPAEGNVVLIYQARANTFADPTAGGQIVNTVTVTGDGISTPITATETVGAEEAADLTITKTITPTQVVDNDRVTYTFVIQNRGNAAVVATDNAVITDTFNPILTDLVVTLNGVTLTEGVQYTYNETTGLFQTLPGQLTVPAATYTQDTTTGEYTVTPGITTLVVVGTI
jgi:uncharacterized repeat protein (TIGR01451 family)